LPIGGDTRKITMNGGTEKLRYCEGVSRCQAIIE
jgi:hypothetical protein